ncbi:MAG: CHAT domain-containing protein, partial [Anaerolineae bacterium]|nr:CHAT domain-containing protein [Anaerolineae bacterium]
GQYAVLWLSELIQALQKESDTLWQGMLDAALADVPNLLAPLAADAVERATMSTREAQHHARKTPGKRLVVLDGGQVAGLLAETQRDVLLGVDLEWLNQSPETLEELGLGEKGFAMLMDEKTAADELGVLRAEEAGKDSGPPLEIEPEKRWINAEIEDHDKHEPLQLGEVYTLAFDVDTELRDAAVGAAGFDYHFRPDEQLVTLTVQLQSDDFEIYTEPQKLRVPRTGKSKGKARFDIEPQHEGEGTLNAIFLKDGNFIQLLTLKLRTGAAGQTGVLAAETLGRTLDAAFVVQPRDVNLTILNTGTGFKVIMSGAVAALATLPLTMPELDQMIAQVRQELLEIVHLQVSPRQTLIYQAGIDIPPQVNQESLQRLARAGFRLYQRIFYGPAADSQANLLGDKLRAMAQQEMLKIQIFSQQFMLPWGILYLADEYDPEDINPELFLGLKHIIEHIPLQQNMQVTDTTIDSHPALAVSLNVNADIDQQMGRPLIADQRNYWDKLDQSGGAQVIVRESKDEVTQALADTATPDQILYFYCHAISKSLAEAGGPDDSTLVLSGGQRLTLEDLNLFASTRKVLPGAPLVFINACESAELSPLFYDGFVPYFMAKGARGVIGTECETPALFAAEWARRFFDQFLAGASLGQVFLDLRREFYYEHHNLLGLLYALYADGDTRIVPGVNLAKVPNLRKVERS